MRLSDVRKKLKKNRFMFFTYRKFADNDYKSGLRDFRKLKPVKGRDTIERELALLRNYWKCDPMHYYRYRLYEKQLPEEDLKDYIPAYYFYNYHMASVNDEAMLPVTGSKIRLNDFFCARNIPTPHALAVIRKGLLTFMPGNEMSFEAFIRELSSSSSKAFFVKPDNGMGGKGIFTITKKQNGFVLPGNVPLGRKQLAEFVRKGDYIVQEAISQRSDIRLLYPSSVNTLRVITQKSGENFRIAAVVMRIGRNGSYVDNSTQGGISINVDVETGILGKYAYTEHSTERFDRHPDTGIIFDGFVLSHWDLIRTSILFEAAKIPELPEAGWDIAVQEQGITVIEINMNYGIDHLQCCIGGMRRRLNVMPEY